MIVFGRHRALTHDAWSELAARAAIEEIAADAIAQFDPDTFWPGHPSDDGVGDGNPNFRWQRHPVAARVGLVDADAASAGGRVCAEDTRSECVAV